MYLVCLHVTSFKVISNRNCARLYVAFQTLQHLLLTFSVSVLSQCACFGQFSHVMLMFPSFSYQVLWRKFKWNNARKYVCYSTVRQSNRALFDIGLEGSFDSWYTRWFKYDRDDLCVNKSQFVPLKEKTCAQSLYLIATLHFCLPAHYSPCLMSVCLMMSDVTNICRLDVFCLNCLSSFLCKTVLKPSPNFLGVEFQ
jgi:hypothetical protein